MLLIYCKELVTASQSFPSTVASERLGISNSEPLVTRDALDKYQIVAEKVVHISFSIVSPPFFNSFFLVFFSCVCVGQLLVHLLRLFLMYHHSIQLNLSQNLLPNHMGPAI